MFCMSCGKQLPEEANFCFNCGKPQKPHVQAVATERAIAKFRLILQATIGRRTEKSLFSSKLVWDQTAAYKLFVQIEDMTNHKREEHVIATGQLNLTLAPSYPYQLGELPAWYTMDNQEFVESKDKILKLLSTMNQSRWNVKDTIEEVYNAKKFTVTMYITKLHEGREFAMMSYEPVPDCSVLNRIVDKTIEKS